MSVLYATLLDAVGVQVTVETTHGFVYTGKLEAVDKVGMNLRMSAVMVTQPNGMKDVAASVLIKGTEQKFVKLPSTMKLAPQFRSARNGSTAAAVAAAASSPAGRGAVGGRKKGTGGFGRFPGPKKNGDKNKAKKA
jgi:small nuclear ribonucleoprotein (snRNP)-like protein